MYAEMGEILKEDEESWKTARLLFNSARKRVETKVEVLNDEFQYVHNYNPIENIKSRLKSEESIRKKLARKGKEYTIENMLACIEDVAGVRIVCSFTSDIYKLAEMIGMQSDLKVVAVKDYMRKPKASGYKSFHMIVTVPVYLSDKAVETKVEIQIRTIAIDFWASLEHKIYYKFEGDAPEYISSELQECARIVSMLDEMMLSLNNVILEEKAKREEAEIRQKLLEMQEEAKEKSIENAEEDLIEKSEEELKALSTEDIQEKTMTEGE